MSIEYSSNDTRFKDHGLWFDDDSALVDVPNLVLGTETDVDDLELDFIESLSVSYYGEPRILFDDFGSITLQLPGFCHCYNDVFLCADAIWDWIGSKDTSGWEGNDDGSLFEPTEDHLRSEYRVYTLDEFLNLSISGLIGNSIEAALYYALLGRLVD